MHLLIYFFKESVANDVINVLFFACDRITLKAYSVIRTRQDIDKMSGNQKSTEWND